MNPTTLNEVWVHLALLLSQLLGAAAAVVNQQVLGSGMHQLVYSFYCGCIALLLLIPMGYIVERRRPLEVSHSEIFLKVLLLGSLYLICQVTVMAGIKNTSADFLTEIEPIVPVVATAFAIFLRLEKLNLWQRSDQAKLAGILICSSGALVMAMYFGPCVAGDSCNSIRHTTINLSFTPNWNLGVACIFTFCFAAAIGVCVQALVLQKSPAPFQLATYTLAIGTVLLGISAKAVVPDASRWKLSLDSNLAGILFSGTVEAGLCMALMVWCVGRAGPVLVACYTPVQPVATSIMSLIFFGTNIYLGGLLGAAVIVAGLVLLSWGREKSLKSVPPASEQSINEALVS